ncbi:MAG: Hsp70 family protein [Eubacteriales bacterium]|nr:Hsp70 family protein [Eubacteriales bacterium]
MAEKVVKIGIDFGTTYSFAGFLHGDRVMPLIPAKETYGIPSVFYYDGKKQLIGKLAVSRATAHPENAVFSIKRNLHQKELTVGGRTFTPKEIVTAIIGYVVECAEKMLEEQYFVEYDRMEAVITVPVDFNNPRIRLIREAAREVRLKNGTRLSITGVIPEPCAAAIEYFGLVPQEERDILVYDLGGGTFDVALVHSSKETSEPYEVIDQIGESSLGGDDWDRALADWVMEQYEREKGKKLPGTALRELLVSARNCKQELTEIETAEASIQIRGDIFETEISREKFEDLTRGLLERTLEDLRKLLSRQSDRALRHVILTGGSTYMPQIMRSLREEKLFSEDVEIRFVEPEHAIAYGAARYADILPITPDTAEDKHEKSRARIHLIAPHNYGIIYHINSMQGKEMIEILIRKGTRLPAAAESISYVRSENSRTSQYVICESDNLDERQLIELTEGREIMTARLERQVQVPKGTQARQILTLGEDLILQFRAEDRVYGAAVETKVQLEMKL